MGVRKKEFVVVGLGRFGSQVARTLSAQGREVLAIDREEKRAHALSATVTYVVQADAAEMETARSLGLANFDTAIVAIGNDLESSVLVTMLFKELGVKEVIAKASSENHGKLLEKVGADRVIFPERDMAERLARSLISENLIDYLELTPDVSIAEVTVGDTLGGHALRELNLISRFGVTVMAMRQAGGDVKISPAADDVLANGDILVIIGKNSDISRLQEWMGS